MYAAGLTRDTDTHVNLSYRERDGWTSFFDGASAVNFITVGDNLTGPSLGLVALSTGDLPPAEPHFHASDSFRLCLHGEQTFGRKTYVSGDFRLQKGWVPYTNENYGPNGAWTLILGADRRGSRARMCDEELAASELDLMIRQVTKELTMTFGIEVDDWLSDDPAHTSGPSSVATTLGKMQNSGKLDGSFSDVEAWQAVSDATRVAVALMGEPQTGPVIITASTGANAVAMPRCKFQTEIVRMIVRGSCEIDGESYEPGDIRIQRSDQWCPEVHAGPDGLDELLVVGDRRHVDASVDDTSLAGWPGALGGIIRDLTDALPVKSWNQS